MINNNLMHICDLLPTLYSAAGGKVSQLGPIDGVNHWPSLLTLAMNGTSSSSNLVSDTRKHLLHNIDHQGKFWAIRSGRYKLTSGTWNAGRWDVWYKAPGQINEFVQPCYNCTEVYKILSKRGQMVKPIKIEVKCDDDEGEEKEEEYDDDDGNDKKKKTTTTIERKRSKHKSCLAVGQNNDQQFCLFDIKNDPCEKRNIAQANPMMVKKLFALYQYYNQTYARPVNKPSDNRANPALHGGWWSPWIDLI